MTREEAIAFGKRVIDLGFGDETQAFCEMAIQALEQEPDLIHNEREQAYMKGYEDASKRFRTEPCEDAISRQAAIRLAEQGQVQGFEWQFKQLVELPPVSVAEKVGRWIPVSERLPEEGTYLICTDKGYIATIMYDRSMGWLLDANIIAYMPLPQPYMVESEE